MMYLTNSIYNCMRVTISKHRIIYFIQLNPPMIINRDMLLPQPNAFSGA